MPFEDDGIDDDFGLMQADKYLTHDDAERAFKPVLNQLQSHGSDLRQQQRDIDTLKYCFLFLCATLVVFGLTMLALVG